ncbi:hypothetical protein BD769DRAFT_1385778 [Suillus cothurnatus]|nr:hypothetical protein BD769DRAFT_1385778 [Suillus cothurnatus]
MGKPYVEILPVPKATAQVTGPPGLQEKDLANLTTPVWTPGCSCCEQWSLVCCQGYNAKHEWLAICAHCHRTKHKCGGKSSATPNRKSGTSRPRSRSHCRPSKAHVTTDDEMDEIPSSSAPTASTPAPTTAAIATPSPPTSAIVILSVPAAAPDSPIVGLQWSLPCWKK